MSQVSLSEGAKLLTSLFLKKEKQTELFGKTQEILKLYIDFWYKNDYLDPMINTKDVVYGSFEMHEIFKEVIEEFKEEIEKGQPECVTPIRKRLAERINEEYFGDNIDSPIDIQAVKETVEVMVTNRLWDDVAVKSYMSSLYGYASVKDEAATESSPDTIVLEFVDGVQYKISQAKWKDMLICYRKEYDGIEYWEELRDYFNDIEGRNWKQALPQHLRKFVDRINLKNLKLLMTDYFGNPFRPQGWQAEFLLSHRRFNIVVASRRAGKSMLSAYLCGRQLYIPTTIAVFVVPTMKNHGRVPWRYIMQMVGNDQDVIENKNDGVIRHEKNKSEIIFISGDKALNVRSDSANLLVLDESAYLKQQVYTSAEPLTRNVKGMSYIISTVNIDTPKNWFYYELIAHEIEAYSPDSNLYARRVTLYDNPFIDDAEKADIEKAGLRDPKRFGAEYMCDFQESDHFDLKSFWTISYDYIEKLIAGTWMLKMAPSVLIDGYYTHFVVAYDAARIKDNPALLIAGLRGSTYEVCGGGYMKGLEYYEQSAVLHGVVEFLGFKKTKLLLEENQNGIVVGEILRKEYRLFSIAIQVVGGLVENTEETVKRISKDVLLSATKSAMSLGCLKGLSFITELRLELEAYDPENEHDRTGGHHYDLLSCLRLIGRRAKYTGLFTLITKKQTEDLNYAQEMIRSVQRLVGKRTSGTNRFGRFGY